MSMRGRVALTLLAGCLVLVAGCGTAKKAPDVSPVSLTWQEVALPVPPGDPGRLALRDVVACDGKWFAVGGVIGGAAGADEASRPAAWASPDGQTWRALTMAPVSYYGKLNTLYSAACKGGRLAAIGAKSGGAHGNPRVSTWYLRDDTMVEVTAEFTLYGGSEAVNVGRMSAGPKGYLIAGNRVSGAAAWLSADATGFKLVEAAPNLASDPQTDTFADDGAVTDNGFMLVGGGTTKGHIDRDPMVWTSDDGTAWKRVVLTHDTTYEELQRVVRVGDQFVAVGLHGDQCGAWRGSGDSWQPAGRFGAGSGHNGLGAVRSATVVKGAVLVSAQDGARYGMWLSSDTGQTWRSVNLPPGDHPAGSERDVAVTAAGDTVITVADDSTQGRVWSAHYSG